MRFGGGLFSLLPGSATGCVRSVVNGDLIGSGLKQCKHCIHFFLILDSLYVMDLKLLISFFEAVLGFRRS